MQSHIFPIEDQDTYAARIQFSVHEVTPPSVTDSVKFSAKNAASSTDSLSAADFSGTGDPGLNAAVEAAKPTFEQQARSIQGKLLTPLTISATPRERCILYMPQSIQVQDGVQYDNVELGVLGTAMKDMLSAGATGLSAGSKAIGASITSFLKGNTTATDQSRVALTRLANFGGSAVSGATRMALQTAPNPNVRAIFKAVSLREPAFTFKLIPKSKRESEEIIKIVDFFRENMYPEEITDNIAGTDIPIGYKFPDLFRVKILYNNRERREPVMKYKDMYLKSFSANFNSSGMGFHEGGDFSEVDITVNFIESETLSRNDVRNQRNENRRGFIPFANQGIT